MERVVLSSTINKPRETLMTEEVTGNTFHTGVNKKSSKPYPLENTAVIVLYLQFLENTPFWC